MVNIKINAFGLEFHIEIKKTEGNINITDMNGGIPTSLLFKEEDEGWTLVGEDSLTNRIVNQLLSEKYIKEKKSFKYGIYRRFHLLKDL